MCVWRHVVHWYQWWSNNTELMRLHWLLLFMPLGMNSNFKEGIVYVQWRNDFVNSLVKIPDSHEMQEECLGMAVLDMTRTAKERQLSPLDIYHTIRWVTLTGSSFHPHKSLVPASRWHRSFVVLCMCVWVCGGGGLLCDVIVVTIHCEGAIVCSFSVPWELYTKVVLGFRWIVF